MEIFIIKKYLAQNYVFYGRPGDFFFFCKQEELFGRLHIAPLHFLTTSVRSAKSSREIVDKFMNFFSTFFNLMIDLLKRLL